MANKKWHCPHSDRFPVTLAGRPGMTAGFINVSATAEPKQEETLLSPVAVEQMETLGEFNCNRKWILLMLGGGGGAAAGLICDESL